eukprot:3690058-Amphidinium_carterae.1
MLDYKQIKDNMAAYTKRLDDTTSAFFHADVGTDECDHRGKVYPPRRVNDLIQGSVRIYGDYDIHRRSSGTTS